MTTDTNYVCDLCGFSADTLDEVTRHLGDEHNVDEPVEVGRVDQSEDSVLKLQHGDGSEIRIDLVTWLKDQLGDD